MIPRMGKFFAVIAALGVSLALAAPAHADIPGYPADGDGCASRIIFGLDPHYVAWCDTPIRPDGSWDRSRKEWSKEYVHSTCGQYGYFTRTGYYCPDWAPKDTIPARTGPIETYVVTQDTIPAGEPGHVD